jgi:hypothetical protein
MNASLVVERGQSAVGRFVSIKGVALEDVLVAVRRWEEFTGRKAERLEAEGDG